MYTCPPSSGQTASSRSSRWSRSICSRVANAGRRQRAIEVGALRLVPGCRGRKHLGHLVRGTKWTWDLWSITTALTGRLELASVLNKAAPRRPGRGPSVLGLDFWCRCRCRWSRRRRVFEVATPGSDDPRRGSPIGRDRGTSRRCRYLPSTSWPSGWVGVPGPRTGFQAVGVIGGLPGRPDHRLACRGLRALDEEVRAMSDCRSTTRSTSWPSQVSVMTEQVRAERPGSSSDAGD